jgi:hypothetical protein
MWCSRFPKSPPIPTACSDHIVYVKSSRLITFPAAAIPNIC